MNTNLQNTLTVLGRVFIVLIFLLSAVGNKIPNYGKTVEYMASEGVPAPGILLAGAIVFLIVGSLSILLGYKARIGAVLLFVFLLLATYFFHDFWTFEDPQARRMQNIQFMKNLSMMGTMLFLMANGAGSVSFDSRKSLPSEALTSQETG